MFVREILPDLELVVAELPRLRAQLRASAPFGQRVLHGDLHPGNVLVRVTNGEPAPVFVDWARARVGSALEDVSSWLRSLATWEPEMQRRHDTLFVRYLAARGLSPRLTSEVREQYWFAAASNALAGALGFHLEQLASSPALDPSSAAARSARSWLNAVRQARARL